MQVTTLSGITQGKDDFGRCCLFCGDEIMVHGEDFIMNGDEIIPLAGFWKKLKKGIKKVGKVAGKVAKAGLKVASIAAPFVPIPGLSALTSMANNAMDTASSAIESVQNVEIPSIQIPSSAMNIINQVPQNFNIPSLQQLKNTAINRLKNISPVASPESWLEAIQNIRNE